MGWDEGGKMVKRAWREEYEPLRSQERVICSVKNKNGLLFLPPSKENVAL